MPGISMSSGDTVTFTLSLPVSADFDEYVKALKEARDNQAKMRNVAAAQALHTLMVLAEGGNILFKTSAQPPVIHIPEAST